MVLLEREHFNDYRHTYFFHSSSVEFVQSRHNVRHVEPWISIFLNWVKSNKIDFKLINKLNIEQGLINLQVISKQFEHISVSCFWPCNVQV